MHTRSLYPRRDIKWWVQNYYRPLIFTSLPPHFIILCVFIHIFCFVLLVFGIFGFIFCSLSSLIVLTAAMFWPGIVRKERERERIWHRQTQTHKNWGIYFSFVRSEFNIFFYYKSGKEEGKLSQFECGAQTATKTINK